MGDRSRKRHRWRRRFLIILLLYAGYRGILYVRAALAMHAARAMGGPITIEQWDEWYAAAPPEKNTALLYQEAFDALGVADNLSGEVITSTGGTRGASRRSDPEKALEFRTKALDLFHKAADLYECRFPGSYRDFDITRGFPRDPEINMATQFLDAQTKARANEGDCAGALEIVRATAALARAIGREPSLPAQQQYYATTSWVVGGLGHALTVCDAAPESLDALDAVLASMEESENLVRSFKATGALGYRIFHDHRLYAEVALGIGLDLRKTVRHFWRSVEIPSEAILYHIGGATGFRDFEKGSSTRWLVRLEAVSEMPAGERAAALQALDMSRRRWPGGMFSAQVYDYLRGFFELDSMRRSDLVAARTAIALERYWLENRALPESLDALVPRFLPEAPRDPYMMLPLLYVPSGEGDKEYTLETPIVPETEAPSSLRARRFTVGERLDPQSQGYVNVGYR